MLKRLFALLLLTAASPSFATILFTQNFVDTDKKEYASGEIWTFPGTKEASLITAGVAVSYPQPPPSKVDASPSILQTKDVSSSTNIFYPPTAAETAAGLTPANQWYATNNAWRYLSTAQILDAIARTKTTTDDAALNSACEAAWLNGVSLYIPGGAYKVASSLAFPCQSATDSRGNAFTLYGDGAGDPFSAIPFTNSTVIVGSGTTVPLTIGPGGGAGTGTGSQYIHDIRFECSNTTQCINATVISDSVLERVNILQSGTGDGIDVGESIATTYRDMMVMNSGKVTTGGTKTGIGININQTGGDAGASVIAHSLVAGFNLCIDIGTTDDAIETTKIVDSAVQTCIDGVHVAIGANKTVIDTLYEENVTGTVVQDKGSSTTVRDSYFFPGFTIGIDGSAIGDTSNPGGGATYVGNQFNMNVNNSFGIKTACQSFYETPCPNTAQIENNSFIFGGTTAIMSGVYIGGASPNVVLLNNSCYPDDPGEVGGDPNANCVTDTSTGLGFIGVITYSTAAVPGYRFPLFQNIAISKLLGYTISEGSGTGTTCTLTSTAAGGCAGNTNGVLGDCGQEITLTNASAITVTIPTGLAVGCTVGFIQGGAGKVSVNGSAVSAATLHSKSSYTGTSGQWAEISIKMISSGVAVLTGDGS